MKKPRRRKLDSDLAVVNQEVLAPQQLPVSSNGTFINVLYITAAEHYGVNSWKPSHVRLQTMERFLEGLLNTIGPGFPIHFENCSPTGASFELTVKKMMYRSGADYAIIELEEVTSWQARCLIKHGGWKTVGHFERQRTKGQRRLRFADPLESKKKPKRSQKDVRESGAA